MEKDFYSQFKKMSERARLSQEEKDFHRGEVLKFMEKQPSPYVDKKLPSPFYVGMLLKRHFMVTSLAVVLLLSGGLTISADSSLPNDYLYQIKTKITEPVVVFFTPDKAKIKVTLVERRLQEFSQVVLNEEINSEDKAAFVSQLSLQVEGAHEEIKKLKKNNKNADALKATNDLQSVLSAQNIVLEKIHTVDPGAENSIDVEDLIDDSIEKTTEIEEDITETIQNSESETELDQTIDNQKKEITESLAGIEEQKQESILEDGDDLNLLGIDSIDQKVSDINADIENADIKTESGEKDEALLLYNQADQDLGELQKLIEIGRSLKVDNSIDSNNDVPN